VNSPIGGGSAVEIALSNSKPSCRHVSPSSWHSDSSARVLIPRSLAAVNKGEHHLMQSLRSEMNATDEENVELEKSGGVFANSIRRALSNAEIGRMPTQCPDPPIYPGNASSHLCRVPHFQLISRTIRFEAAIS